jgi:hypothetical protein
MYAPRSDAIVSDSPMPWPTSDRAGGAIPARRHSASSLRCVPELSPRDMNDEPVAAMRRRAAPRSCSSRTPAGSSGGPAMMKLLAMTGIRRDPWPAVMKASSSAGECTSRTSASRRRPSAIASPLPTAITVTRMFGCSRWKAGISTSSRPESTVDVVDARISSSRGSHASIDAAMIHSARRARLHVERSSDSDRGGCLPAPADRSGPRPRSR